MLILILKIWRRMIFFYDLKYMDVHVTSCHFCVCLFLFPCVFCFLFYFVVSLSWYVVPTSRVFTSCRGDCVPQFLICFTCGQLPLPSLCLYISLCVPLCVCRFVLVSTRSYTGLNPVSSRSSGSRCPVSIHARSPRVPRASCTCLDSPPVPPLSVYVLFVSRKRLRFTLNTFIYIPLHPGSISLYQNLTVHS